MQKLGNLARLLFWLLLLSLVVAQLGAFHSLDRQGAQALEQYERHQHSRAAGIMCREGSADPFGAPVAQTVNIDNSEAALRYALGDGPLNLIPHTTADTVLILERTVKALVEDEGKVTVFVRYYGSSGDTRFALATATVMDRNPMLRPVYTRIGVPPASIVKTVELKGAPDRRTSTLQVAARH